MNGTMNSTSFQRWASQSKGMKRLIQNRGNHKMEGSSMEENQCQYQ
jgi:hypothetical protein